MTAQPAEATRIQMPGVVPVPSFGERLRAARLHVGWQAREMANAMSIKPSAFSHYETGRHVPRNLRQFCLAVQFLTGVDAGWLETGEAPVIAPPDGLEPSTLRFLHEENLAPVIPLHRSRLVLVDANLQLAQDRDAS